MTIPDLQLGGPQTIVLAVFAAIALSLASLFTVIAFSSRQDVEFPRVQQVGYWIRRRWLIFLLILAAVQVGISFAYLPYSQAKKPDVTVQLTGYQFNWSMDRTQIPAGSTVRFVTSSTDVNHALGIYDPDGAMIGTVQVMPGYRNKLQIRLKKAGKYLIACLEFCGIGHHVMMRNFEVVKR